MASDPDIMSVLALVDMSIDKGDYDRARLLLKGALADADKTSPNDIKLRLDLLMKLAEVNHVTGQWVDALMYLDMVLQVASERNLVGMMGDALIASGTILAKKGKWDIAQKKFEQVVGLLGVRSQHPNMARALIGKGIIFWRRGRPEDAIRLAKEALSIGRALENEEIMGSAHALIASAAFDIGEYELSLSANEKALENFKKVGNIIEATRVLNNMGETYKVMGDYGKAIDFFNGGLNLTSGKGVRRNMAYLLTNLSECHIRQGRNIEARTFATMAEENVAGIQDEYLQAMLKLVWGLIYEHEQDLGKASENYMAALLKLIALGIPFDTGVVHLAYSSCLVKQGKLEEAKTHTSDAVTCFKATGSKLMAERASAELESLKKLSA